MTVMISLGCSLPARLRRFLVPDSALCSQPGLLAIQKSSTSTNSSSKLMFGYLLFGLVTCKNTLFLRKRYLHSLSRTHVSYSFKVRILPQIVMRQAANVWLIIGKVHN